MLDWLVQQIDSDEIEEVTDEILDSLIEKHLAILTVFCKNISHNMIKETENSRNSISNPPFDLYLM